MIAHKPEDGVRAILTLGDRRITRALALGFGTRTFGSESFSLWFGLPSARAISSRESWPVEIGSRPLMPWADSPSAIAFTSMGCSLQNVAICSNDSAVLSTSQTAVALGISSC